jgi:DnaJ-class molecular chaperone
MPPPDMIAFYRNLLGLKLQFTYTELKTAFRESVAKYHPDTYSSSSSRDRENAEMLMKQINEAYDTLKKVVSS